jgi:hypothetical protein
MVTVTKNVYKSVEVAKDDKTITLVVGNNISFATEDGVSKKGVLVDIGRGKEEKTTLILQPHGEPQKETWCVIDIKENTLEIDENAE